MRLWNWYESTFDKKAHARPAGRVVIPVLWRVRSDFRDLDIGGSDDEPEGVAVFRRQYFSEYPEQLQILTPLGSGALHLRT